MRGQAAIPPLFLALLLICALLPGGPWGPDRVVFAIFVEAALLAIAASAPMRGWVFLSVIGSGAVATTGVALFCAPDRIGSVLLSHLLLGAYAGFLRGLSLALGRPLGPRAAGLIAALIGLALLVSPLWIDPVLDLFGPGGVRSRLLHTSLVLNPLASISRGLFDIDWIREGSLYARTRFASTDPFVYPAWTTTLGTFLALWGAVFVIGRIGGGTRPPAGEEEGGRPPESASA